MVPVVELSRRGHRFAAAFAQAAHRISTNGSFLLGTETSAFETEFSELVGQAHCVALSSGASALQLALAAVGVGPGDEVIVPAFTAVPTASAVCALGAVPVFVDVDAETANLNPALVNAATTSRTRAVVVVHLYGRRAELPVTDLPIVEDAAQAHGAVDHHSGSAAVAYSFYPTKNLGGIGDGGAVVTNDAGLDDRVRLMRVHGMRTLYVHEVVSQNFRMSELEAAWLRLALSELLADNQRRGDIARTYRAAAAHLAWQADSPHHAYHLCVLRAQRREQFRDFLTTNGVASAVHYPLALTQQPAYRHFSRCGTPMAQAWAAGCVSVPCFPEMTDDEVQHVAQVLAEAPR